MTQEDPTYGVDIFIDPHTDAAMKERAVATAKATIPEEKPKPRMKRIARQVNKEAVIEDEDMLQITQEQRLAFIDLLGETLDFSKAMSASAYAGVLNDLDKASLTRMKLRLEEGASGNIANAAATVLSMFAQLENEKLNPAHVPNGAGSGAGFKGDVTVEKAELVPGELETGTQTIPKEFLDEVYDTAETK